MPPEAQRTLAGGQRLSRSRRYGSAYRLALQRPSPPSGDGVTWSKYGAEFWDDLANVGLSDAAARTHAEAIGWIYRVEQTELTIGRHLVRRFAGSSAWQSAVVELVSAGYWRESDGAYEIVHHADVIRASIAAQQVKRDRDKRAARAYRKRVSADVDTDAVADVSACVIVDTDSQTDSLGSEQVQEDVVSEEDEWTRPPSRPPWTDAEAVRSDRASELAAWDASRNGLKAV